MENLAYQFMYRLLRQRLQQSGVILVVGLRRSFKLFVVWVTNRLGDRAKLVTKT